MTQIEKTCMIFLDQKDDSMQILTLLKIINNDYGNWIIALITLFSITISVKATKDAILARITSGLPFLRMQAMKDNEEKTNEAEISFTINPFKISDDDISESKRARSHIYLVNYGNGPAVEIGLDKLGSVKNSEIPKKDISKIKIEKVPEEISAIDIPGNFNDDYAIFPKDKIKINLEIIYHPNLMPKPDITKDPVSGKNISFFYFDNEHYWFKIRYKSLADTKEYHLYSRLMPIIMFNEEEYEAHVFVFSNINKPGRKARRGNR